MKKYLAGFLMLGVLVFTGAMPSKANAGLTVAQQNSIITMLQNAGATPQALAQVQAAFGTMPTSSAGTTGTGGGTTTTTTTSSTGGTILPCTNNAAFNFTNGNPCSNYVPTTAAGTTNTTTVTTTPTTNPVNPNTPLTPSNCISIYTNVAPYVYINGAQVSCVKQCVGQVAWNVITNSMCPSTPVVVTPPTTGSSHSVTVIAPNGAEEYMPGASVGVKWESTGIPSTNDQVSLLLKYYTPEGVYVNSVKLLDNLTVNDGGELVTFPSTLPAGATWGNNFKVSVSIETATDDSDKNFIIQ